MRAASLLLLTLSLALGACAKDPMGGTGDGDTDPDYTGPVSMHGELYLEESGDQAAGVTIELLDQSGTKITETTADASGRWALQGVGNTVYFLRISPSEGHAGLLRVEHTSGAEYESNPATLPSLAGLRSVAESLGMEYDESKAAVNVGYNPVSREAGGEGATISAGNEVAANIVANGGIPGNRLLPICEGDGCAPSSRTNNVVFLNVEGSTTSVSLVNPSGGICAFRENVSAWRLYPNTVTSINVDCE